MANTFKFGNGEWAVGKETALAYNDENSNFKPLPFTFDRGSIGTVVNKQGLIETVGIDEPRIDFLNNTKGHLLFEPERRNVVTYSEKADEWGRNNSQLPTLDTSINNPYGVAGAYTTSGNGNSNFPQYTVGTISPTSSGTATASVFLKQFEAPYIYIKVDGTNINNTNTTSLYKFTFSTKTVAKSTGADAVSTSVQDYGNGWYRVIFTYTYDGTANFSFRIRNYNGETEKTEIGTSKTYAWGAQIEVGSYATSYIPTQGSAETRIAEIPFGREDMVDLNLYSSEMTWFYDINLFYREAGTTVAPRLINTSNNQVFIGVNTPQSPNTDLRIRHKNGTTALNTSAVTFTNGGRFKVAVKITGTTGTAYINGTNVGTFTTLAASNYDKYENVQNNPNNINDMRFYNTALSDSELETLTTL